MMMPWWTFPFAFGVTFVAFWASVGIGFGLAALPLSNDWRGSLAIASGVTMGIAVISALLLLSRSERT